MILSDSLILKEMGRGNIDITGFNSNHINPCSVDLTLNPILKVYPGLILDTMKENEVEELKIPNEGLKLVPGELYLGSCNEEISVGRNLRAKAEGKSSLGRLGMFIHITAGFIDPGFKGSLVLEIAVIKPLIVYPNMKICQLEFSEVAGTVLQSYGEKSNSKYQNQSGAQHSLYYKNRF